jgi:hypothetical protein
VWDRPRNPVSCKSLCVFVCVTSDLCSTTSLIPFSLQSFLSHNTSFPNCPNWPYKATLKLLIPLLKPTRSWNSRCWGVWPRSHFHSDSARVIMESRPPRGCSFFSSFPMTGNEETALCCQVMLWDARCFYPTCLPAFPVPWSQQTILFWSFRGFMCIAEEEQREVMWACPSYPSTLLFPQKVQPAFEVTPVSHSTLASHFLKQ